MLQGSIRRYPTWDQRIRDEPKPTPTTYVLSIHHVLNGNNTTPRYVSVRTERDGTEGLVS